MRIWSTDGKLCCLDEMMHAMIPMTIHATSIQLQLDQVEHVTIDMTTNMATDMTTNMTTDMTTDICVGQVNLKLASVSKNHRALQLSRCLCTFHQKITLRAVLL